MKFQKRIKINNKWIGGKNDACFIIAEAGSNHNRDLGTAKNLIDAAKDAGVDAVKFQIYPAKNLYSRKLKALPGEREKPFNVIKKIETPRQWIPELAAHSKKRGLIFISTPFDKEAIDELNPFVSAFKWASPELIDRPLLEYVAKKKKPLIISTGFYGMKETADVLRWVKAIGNNKIVLLQCTGLYPPLPKEVNLKAMLTMRKIFKVPVGFSDHTVDTITSAVAVAMGAKVVEKHFTLNRKMEGPDHFFALEPGELKEMVENIRNIEKSLGSGVKKPVEREVKKEKLIRRGIVAVKDLKRGEKIALEDIAIKRVGAGAILPKHYKDILGRKLIRDVKIDQKITWKMI